MGLGGVRKTKREGKVSREREGPEETEGGRDGGRSRREGRNM